MITGIPAYWMKHPNFGDALTPYLIKAITGKDAIWTDQHNVPKYMISGSLLNDPGIESCIVWGTGIAFSDTHIRKPLEIHAVRGPISRDLVMSFGHKCPEVYGDPCLLLPRYYKGAEPRRKFKLGIIPHLVDYTEVKLKYSNHLDTQIIDILSPVEEVVNRVLECDYLISSSLHGLIVSHAYSKPCLWVEFSDKVLGDGTKFRDYLRSVGHTLYEPCNLRNDVLSSEILISKIPTNITLNIDLNALLEACPFCY